MKKIMLLLPVVMFITVTQFAYCQKYTTTSDTVKLNKEYVAVSNDIADLTAKLTIAQNNLPGYNDKANDAKSDAQTAAIKSSEQSSNAVNGDVGDARAAKRKAKKALKDAKHSRHADNNVEDQDKKNSQAYFRIAKKER